MWHILSQNVKEVEKERMCRRKIEKFGKRRKNSKKIKFAQKKSGQNPDLIF